MGGTASAANGEALTEERSYADREPEGPEAGGKEVFRRTRCWGWPRLGVGVLVLAESFVGKGEEVEVGGWAWPLAVDLLWVADLERFWVGVV